jgi:hypothetical protein
LIKKPEPLSPLFVRNGKEGEMKRLVLPMFVAALGVVLSAGTTWAGPATFSYDWTPSVLFVPADGAHNGLDFSNQGSTGPLTTLSAVGNAASVTFDTTHDDVFSAVPYTLKVKITDGADSQSAILSGTISGHIVNGNATDLSATLPTPVSLPAFSNGDTFTATLTAFVPPTFGGKAGGFGFQIDANGGSGQPPPPPPPPPTNDTPEPSTVLLSLVGIGGLGLRVWRNRKLVAA